MGMNPHDMTLFKFICKLYQFRHKTLPIMKNDRAKSNFENLFQQEWNRYHRENELLRLG